jgi:hypothetical protein
MIEVGGTPITRKIRSMKSLWPWERRRLERLKEIFRKEGMLPRETTFWERRYLLRLERARRRYWSKRRFHKRKTPEMRRRLKEWREALERIYPPLPNVEDSDEAEVDEEANDIDEEKNFLARAEGDYGVGNEGKKF